jgi:hypothetical protein
MKLPLLAALATLSLWGCAGPSANTREDSSPQAGATGGSGSAEDSAAADSEARHQEAEQIKEVQESQESPLQSSDVTKKEKRDRMGAPTVYDGEATGGSGSDSTVTTKDGQKWDVQEEPGFENSEPRTTPDKKDATGGSGNGGDADNSGGVGNSGGAAGGASPGSAGSGGGL